MTSEEMKALKPGDVIRHAGDRHAYMVTGNYGGRVTAVRTVDATNPNEWVLEAKSTYQRVTPQ